MRNYLPRWTFLGISLALVACSCRERREAISATVFSDTDEPYVRNWQSNNSPPLESLEPVNSRLTNLKSGDYVLIRVQGKNTIHELCGVTLAKEHEGSIYRVYKHRDGTYSFRFPQSSSFFGFFNTPSYFVGKGTSNNLEMTYDPAAPCARFMLTYHEKLNGFVLSESSGPRCLSINQWTFGKFACFDLKKCAAVRIFRVPAYIFDVGRIKKECRRRAKVGTRKAAVSEKGPLAIAASNQSCSGSIGKSARSASSRKSSGPKRVIVQKTVVVNKYLAKKGKGKEIPARVVTSTVNVTTTATHKKETTLTKTATKTNTVVVTKTATSVVHVTDVSVTTKVVTATITKPACLIPVETTTLYTTQTVNVSP